MCLAAVVYRCDISICVSLQWFIGVIFRWSCSSSADAAAVAVSTLISGEVFASLTRVAEPPAVAHAAVTRF